MNQNSSKRNLLSSGPLRQIGHIVTSGLASSLAYSIVYPFESIKTIAQIASEGTTNSLKGSYWGRVKAVLKENGGVRNLYQGLGAAIMHPLICSAMRLGLYFVFEDYALASHGETKRTSQKLSFFQKSFYSLLSGGLGEILVIPFDVIYVRFQVDNALEVQQKKAYKGIANALMRIAKEEGILSLWRGTIPSILKCMTINFGMLTPYNECKEQLAEKCNINGKLNYLISAAVAGLGASFLGLPVDNIKVKIQKSAGNKEYR